MRLFRVTLALWERNSLDEWEKDKTSRVSILTIAKDMPTAEKFVVEAYKEADHTDEEFDWRPCAIEEVDELFAIPATKRILPDTE